MEETVVVVVRLSQHWWKSFFEDQTKNSISLPSTSYSTLGKFISEDNVTTTTTVSSITINEVEQLGSGLQTYYKKNTLVVIHGSHGNSYVPYCVGKALSSTQDSVHVLLYTTQNGTTWKEGTTTITISVREVLTSKVFFL